MSEVGRPEMREGKVPVLAAREEGMEEAAAAAGGGGDILRSRLPLPFDESNA